MGVDIDPAGRDEESAGVDLPSSALADPAHLGHAVPGDAEVGTDLTFSGTVPTIEKNATTGGTIGGGGNAAETTKGHIDAKHAYIVICGIAVAVAFMSTMEVLALASRAFAFYYMLQCLVAITVSKSTVQRVGMAMVAAALGFITVFAVPAS